MTDFLKIEEGSNRLFDMRSQSSRMLRVIMERNTDRIDSRSVDRRM
jgi:hypothetical protein